MHELEGHGDHGGGEHSHPLVIPVSITISILAVLVAAVTLLGHRAHTEELLLQGQAMNQWAYYQAKNGRMNTDQAVADLLGVVATTDKDEISEKANELQKERGLYQRRADHFDAGEGILEFALIICSLTLLTNKRLFWLSGIAIGLIGVGVALTG